MAKKRRTNKRSSTKTEATQPPNLNMLIACDAISRDPNTGKISIYGLFQAVHSASYPVVFRPFALLSEMTGSGEYTVGIWIVGPTDESQKIGEMPIECKPGQVAHLDVQVTGFVFEKPGDYEFQLRIGRKVLKPTRKISAVKNTPRKK